MKRFNRYSGASGAVLLAALAHAAPASAQTADAPAEDLAEVVITGSRVATNGFQAPTPVTVLGGEQLKNASPSVTEALRQLPQLSGSTSASNIVGTTGGGPSTNSSANLRNLGVQRTLVLLDGRRPPVTGATGTVDMTFFPEALVKRVDIVTGGASAAYGSDAVAGVVNFVLDTDFEGLLIEGRGGLSFKGDAGSRALSIAGGRKFLDDRLSVIFSLDASQREGLDGTERSYSRANWGTIPNPNAAQPGQPSLLLRRGVTLAAASNGGVIITPGPLLNTAFDANGSPIPFTPGTLNTGVLSVGGDGASYPASLAGDSESASLFGHAKYQVNDSISVFAEASYGVAHVSYANLNPSDLGSSTTNPAYIIRADNAYLPAAIRAIMQANNIAQVSLGKVDVNVGRVLVRNLSHTLNASVGTSIDLPGDFKLDAYYSHAEALLHYGSTNNRVRDRQRLAIDAVVNPATGQIVCRSTLTAPANGCVPLTPFGSQPLTDAQRNYVTAETRARSLTVQDVWAAELRGELFSTWAGPIAAAVGAEYREIATTVYADPISQAIGFSSGNVAGAKGAFNVKEMFGEVIVPLVRDQPWMQSLDVNGAVRRTDYSTSGVQWAWKVGATSELVEGVRLRGTYSQDIRAPNIGELFGGRVRSTANIRDPNFGGRIFSGVSTFSGSNAALQPEKAKTLTLGGVYQPSWAPGLGLSIDYYRIKIEDAIATLAVQTIVDQCSVGNQSLCALVTRDAGGFITLVTAGQQNVSRAKVAGVDFEANYSMEAFGGSLTLRGIASYLDTYRFITPGAPVIEQAGNGDAATGTRPHWRGNLQATWRKDAWTVALQERWIGPVDRVAPPATVDDNSIASTFYTNLTVRYRMQRSGLGDPELFATVSNLFNQKPRVGATTSCSLGQCQVFDGSLYDTIGRYYTVGFRSRF